MLKFTDRVNRVPRLWSNKELRRIAPLLEGDVINVSAWKDEDKDGGHYREYFTSATSYSISNWYSERGFQNAHDEVLLDLDSPLPPELSRKFDVVFNHTTLEHVFDVFQAFENLCELSKDTVVVVVPFMQELHYSEGYLDYWRLTPYALRELFKRNGMECIHESVCDFPNTSVYVISIGSRNAAKWQGKFPALKDHWLGVGKSNVRNDLLQVVNGALYPWMERAKSVIYPRLKMAKGALKRLKHR